MWIALAVLGAALLTGAYLSWTAGRIDRLHARVNAAAAVLDAQLVRRAAAVTTLAGASCLPADLAGRLTEAAAAARAVDGLGQDREAAENGLTRALRAAVREAPDAFDPSAPRSTALAVAATKVGYARRFHNDAVRDTLVLRGRRLPRLFRLAGRAARPGYFEIDDSPVFVDRPVPVDQPTDGRHPVGDRCSEATGGPAGRPHGAGGRNAVDPGGQPPVAEPVRGRPRP